MGKQQLTPKPEVRALSNFVRDTINQTGLSLNAFAQKYRLTYRTLLVLTKAYFVPETSTLEKLSAALSAETGQRITLNDLLSLIDRTDPNQPKAEVIPGTGLIDRWEVLEAYKRLDYNDRIEIASDLCRLCLDDLELLALQPKAMIARLVEREAERRGIGLGRLAELAELPANVIQSIVRELSIDLSWGSIVKLSATVKDRWGDYGNTQEFSILLGRGERVLIAQVREYMNSRKIRTATALAKAVCRDNSLDPDTYQGFDLLLEGLDEILNGEAVSTYSPPLLEALPLLAVALGYNGDVEAMLSGSGSGILDPKDSQING